MEIVARVREEGFALGVHAARVPLAEMIERFLPVLTENARVLGQVLG